MACTHLSVQSLQLMEVKVSTVNYRLVSCLQSSCLGNSVQYKVPPVCSSSTLVFSVVGLEKVYKETFQRHPDQISKIL